MPMASDMNPPHPFADCVRQAVDSGEIAGAVAALASPRSSRIEAFGSRSIAEAAPMQTDSIFRLGSTAKVMFTAAALILLDDRGIPIDSEITRWLPELADRRVLRDPRGDLDDTLPARRQITLRDVLTYRIGIGIYLAQMDTPLVRAMAATGILPQREPVAFAADDFAARLAGLPLAHQPGETFMYHLPDDVLRILIMRISGQPLDEFIAERLFAPLGMGDSGCFVPEGKLDRFTTCYFSQEAPGAPLQPWDMAADRFARPPLFPNQLVSTAADFLQFTAMLLNRGEHQGRQILSPEAAALMTADQLDAGQKALSPAPEGFWQTRGWGMGASVYVRSIPQGPSAGSFSWFGGYGPHFLIDPARRATILLMIPRVVEKYTDTQLGYRFEMDACGSLPEW